MKNEFVPLVRLVERSKFSFHRLLGVCFNLCVVTDTNTVHLYPGVASAGCPDACLVYCTYPACLMSLTVCCTCYRLPRLCRMRLQLCAPVLLPPRVLHIRTQALACCCTFPFVPCCAPMHANGDHPRPCPRMLLRFCATRPKSTFAIFR
jgi:hypothetical protein